MIKHLFVRVYQHTTEQHTATVAYNNIDWCKFNGLYTAIVREIQLFVDLLFYFVAAIQRSAVFFLLSRCHRTKQRKKKSKSKRWLRRQAANNKKNMSWL